MTVSKAKSAHKTSSKPDTGWPDPRPLEEELPPVPEFPLELLPESLRPLVYDISDRMQTPMDYAAACAIVALAGAVNRRASITPKQHDKSWTIVPNLWGTIIGPPGVMKSPVMQAVTAPPQTAEEMYRMQFQGEMEEYTQEKAKADLRRSAWEAQYKKAIRDNDPLPLEPDTSIAKPVQRRLVLQSATYEVLHEILRANPAGVTVIRDELTGWLAELEHQGREAERAFYLQSWNGDTAFSVDRVGRGSIYVPALCVSILGNIQPARLRWYIDNMLRGGPQDDGLLQRFQVTVWPDRPCTWNLVDRLEDQKAFRTVRNIFQQLLSLSADSPLRLRFDEGAQEWFFRWWSELQNTKLLSERPGSLIGHLAKYKKLMPALAGLFELADRAATGTLTNDPPPTIDIQHAYQASELCDSYFEKHAERVYSCITSPQVSVARELARRLQNGDLPSPFSTREVYLKNWSGLTSPNEVRDALAVLEEAHWVRALESATSPAGGRPSEKWEVNPKVERKK